MIRLGDLDVSETHPLASELSSLRAAVAQFQDEAHSSTIKLQRHSLDTTNANERLLRLERENAILKLEIVTLRAHPHPDASPQAHPAVTQVQQLTISLRRLSDKLSSTELALSTRTAELAYAIGEASKAKFDADGAYELAARIRGREEAGKVREIELERKVKAAEEAVKMSDLVVNEYADLVRSLEAKAGMRSPVHSRSESSSSSTLYDPSTVGSLDAATAPVTLADSLVEGKLGLQRLLAEFSTTTENLQSELVRLHGELATSEAKCEAERKSAELNRGELAKAQYELQKLQLDDNTAAKIVSRYMQFSQKSTNTLQDALTTLQTRHAATIDTLSAQLASASSQLESSEGRAERLRYALDDLGADILKETYGRRREVALRIRMINREEKIREELERWIRRADEAFTRDPGDGRAVYERMLKDARAVLSTLDGPSTTSTPSSSGSLARVIAAQNAVDFLSNELQAETARRLDLERFIAQFDALDGPIEATGMILPAFPSPPLVPPSQATKGLPMSTPDVSGDVDTNIPSPVATEPSLRPIAEEVPAKTSDTPHEAAILELLPAQSTNQEDVQPIPDSFSAPSVVVQKKDPNDQTAVIVVESATRSSSTNGDIVAPPVPTSGNPSLSADNPLDSPPEAELAPDVSSDLGKTFDIPESSEPEGPRPMVDADFGHRTPVVIEVALPEEAEPSPSLSSSPTASTPLQTGTELPPFLDSSDPLATEAASFLSLSLIPSPLPDTIAESIPPDTLPLDQSDSLQPQPQLLAGLLQVQHRYDDLQRGFRDCHLALEALKDGMSSVPLDNTFPNSVFAVRSTGISPGVLQTALDRLNDYTEDARVELEIRVADEALVARGYEALLSVLGALSSASTPLLSQSHSSDHESMPSQSEVESQIGAFISGTDLVVQKSQGSLSRKLEDIQHDIASLKLAVHDMVLAPPTPLTAPATNGSSGRGGWTSWMRSSPSVPSTPGSATDLGLGPGPTPTFGNVMTSPKLRHSPSLNFQVQSKKENPFASLGLRVPMPSYVPQGVSQVSQRSRTMSTMYVLGLGARRPSDTGGSFVSLAQQPETGTESSVAVEEDGDVE